MSSPHTTFLTTFSQKALTAEMVGAFEMPLKATVEGKHSKTSKDKIKMGILLGSGAALGMTTAIAACIESSVVKESVFEDFEMRQRATRLPDVCTMDSGVIALDREVALGPKVKHRSRQSGVKADEILLLPMCFEKSLPSSSANSEVVGLGEAIQSENNRKEGIPLWRAVGSRISNGVEKLRIFASKSKQAGEEELTAFQSGCRDLDIILSDILDGNVRLSNDHRIKIRLLQVACSSVSTTTRDLSETTRLMFLNASYDILQCIKCDVNSHGSIESSSIASGQHARTMPSEFRDFVTIQTAGGGVEEKCRILDNFVTAIHLMRLGNLNDIISKDFEDVLSALDIRYAALELPSAKTLLYMRGIAAKAVEVPLAKILLYMRGIANLPSRDLFKDVFEILRERLRLYAKYQAVVNQSIPEMLSLNVRRVLMRLMTTKNNFDGVDKVLKELFPLVEKINAISLSVVNRQEPVSILPSNSNRSMVCDTMCSSVGQDDTTDISTKMITKLKLSPASFTSLTESSKCSFTRTE